MLKVILAGMFSDNVRVERINLPLKRFDGRFAGLRIVQLSDVHMERFGQREHRLVELVNGENPELIFVTGDLLVNYTNEYAAAARFIRELKPQHGIYGVLGNSDHTLRPKGLFDEYLRALSNAGMTVLCNSSVQLSCNGKNIALAGVDDPFLLFDDFERAVSGVLFDRPAILLAHSPDIVFRRTDALVLNRLDGGKTKGFIRPWAWASATYFGPESGEVYFEQDGIHTVRIQSRQDGVSLDTLLLNPYPELDERLASRDVGEIDRFLATGRIPGNFSGLEAVRISMADPGRCHGKWRQRPDDEALHGFRLTDLPTRRRWRYQPEVNPVDYFEADFEAKRNVRYRLWMRMKAFNDDPMADSVYVQFSDALDAAGRRRYRMGQPAHDKSRLEDFDLILTGHTHGGQVRIPFHGAVETMTSVGRAYSAGMHRFGKSWLYVSRGIGTSRLPIRFLCPPEVTVFSLGT